MQQKNIKLLNKENIDKIALQSKKQICSQLVGKKCFGCFQIIYGLNTYCLVAGFPDKIRMLVHVTQNSKIINHQSNFMLSPPIDVMLKSDGKFTALTDTLT